MYARNDKGMNERPAAVIKDLNFMSACLHRDIRGSDTAGLVHPSGCHYHPQFSSLEQARRVEFSKQSFARAVNDKL